jgi:hypothetical protein
MKTKQEIIDGAVTDEEQQEVKSVTLLATLKIHADYYKDWNWDHEAQLLYDAIEEIRRLRKFDATGVEIRRGWVENASKNNE